MIGHISIKCSIVFYIFLIILYSSNFVQFRLRPRRVEPARLRLLAPTLNKTEELEVRMIREVWS